MGMGWCRAMRSTAKLGCSLLSLVVCAIWIWNIHYWVQFRTPLGYAWVWGGVVKYSSGPSHGGGQVVRIERYADNDVRGWTWWGFECYSSGPGRMAITLPLWLPFVLVTTPSVLLWAKDIRRRRRGRAGLCVKCGYPCRGHTPHAKCPECGTTPSTASGG